MRECHCPGVVRRGVRRDGVDRGDVGDLGFDRQAVAVGEDAVAVGRVGDSDVLDSRGSVVHRERLVAVGTSICARFRSVTAQRNAAGRDAIVIDEIEPEVAVAVDIVNGDGVGVSGPADLTGFSSGVPADLRRGEIIGIDTGDLVGEADVEVEFVCVRRI